MREIELRAALDDMFDDDEQRSTHAARFHADQFPPPVNSVCVVGGGTAGYLTAIGLRAAFPKLAVTLVEAKDVPIIGVGEATVDNFPRFLQGLGIDIVALYREVQPTWKLGIRFEWGAPNDYYFNAPFAWNHRGVGLLGSLHYEQTINAMNLHSILMHKKLTPVFETPDGGAVWPGIHYAYHLNNAPFVRFLAAHAEKIGVVCRDLHVTGVDRGPKGQVTALRTKERVSVKADFFVDCTGFRSLLLRESLGARFHAFDTSLFTDSALVFNTPHEGVIKPYTTAKTMSAGWCWNIPQKDEDHCGYVFSSAFISPDAACREIKVEFPSATEPRLVSFRSGRHDRAWIANTFAVGNAYGFVEPLESSGILMIQTHVEHLISLLRAGTDDPSVRHAVNESIRQKWDSLRWFLAIHFQLNHRQDSPFWRAAHSDCDVGDMEPLLEIYRGGAPLALRNPRDLDPYRSAVPLFYGLAGLDCLLLGQRVPTRLLPPVEPEGQWRRKRALAEQIASLALPMDVVLTQLLDQPDSLIAHAEELLSYTL